MHLVQICQRPKRMRISQRDINHALVSPTGQRGDEGRFLPAAGAGRAGEHAEVFPREGAGHPELAELVDEGLPLGGVVAVAGGDAEEEGVVLLHVVGGDEGDGGVLAGGVHFGEDFLGEGFFDSAMGK